MSNNELDKFLKGKLEEQSFEYNPEDWQNALELIEEKDTKRRALWIWWAAAGLVLLLGAGYLINLTSDLVNTNEKLSESITEDIDKSIRTADHLVNTDNTASIDINNTNKTDALVSQVDHQSAANVSITNPVPKEVIPKITSPKPAILGLPDPISGNHPILEPISSLVSESVADVRTREDFSLSNPLVDEIVIDSKVFQLPTLDKAYTSATVFSLTKLDRLIEHVYKPGTYSWETPKVPGKIITNKDMHTKLGFMYGLSAYINPYVGNVDGASKEITGFSGGITMGYRISKSISVNADIIYSYRTGTFDKSNVAETKQYSFDVLDARSTLNPTALHYINLPIYAGVHFGPHRIIVGGSLNYLGGVRGDVVNQTIAKNGDIASASTTSGWIAKDGFTNLNIGGMIGYDYAISNKWNLNFRSSYLFKNIVDRTISERINSFIVKENSQVDLQIGTTYYFR